jgi:hypothetical protein
MLGSDVYVPEGPMNIEQAISDSLRKLHALAPQFLAKCTIDGKESEVSTGDATIKATAKWDGDALVIDFRGPEEGRYFVRKLTLSADGKTMTINIKQGMPNGGMAEKIRVFEKQ